MSIMNKYKQINFKQYEILKSISDRLNILSWALSGLYGYISIKINPIFGSLVITIVWLFLQWCSIFCIATALKYKKE